EVGFGFEVTAIAGQGVAKDQVDGGHEQIDFDIGGCPFAAAKGGGGRCSHVEEADNGDVGGVLECRDDLVDRLGQGGAEDLRQHDLELRLGPGQAQSLGRLCLAGTEPLKSAAQRFGLVAGKE